MAGLAGDLGDVAAHPFATEEDPELAAGALPALIKLSEARVRQIPSDPQARLAAGRLLIAYAGSFVQGPAELLPGGEYEQWAAVMQRAKRLHLRGLGLRAVRVGDAPPWGTGVGGVGPSRRPC